MALIMPGSTLDVYQFELMFHTTKLLKEFFLKFIYFPVPLCKISRN